MGLGQVDRQIQQAIQFARMMLPDDRKNVAPDVTHRANIVSHGDGRGPSEFDAIRISPDTCC